VRWILASDGVWNESNAESWGLASQNGVGIEGRKGVLAFLCGRGTPNSCDSRGVIEGLDEGASGDGHEGAEEKGYQVVRAKFCGWHID
jgi:hypothetical protein